MDQSTPASKKTVKKTNMGESVIEDENHFTSLLTKIRNLRTVMERTEEKVSKVEERMEDKMEKRITA